MHALHDNASWLTGLSSNHPAGCHSHCVPGARTEDKGKQIHRCFHKASFSFSFFIFKFKISLLFECFLQMIILVVFVNPDMEV